MKKTVDLMKQLCHSFEEQKRNGTIFGYMKNFVVPPTSKKVIPGGTFTCSNIGQLKLGGPIDNAAIDVASMSTMAPLNLTFVQYSTNGNGKNISHFSLERSSMGVSKREGDLITKSIIHGLQNIKLDSTCAEALEITKDFQRKFIRDEFPKYLKK